MVKLRAHTCRDVQMLTNKKWGSFARIWPFARATNRQQRIGQPNVPLYLFGVPEPTDISARFGFLGLELGINLHCFLTSCHPAQTPSSLDPLFLHYHPVTHWCSVPETWREVCLSKPVRHSKRKRGEDVRITSSQLPKHPRK